MFQRKRFKSFLATLLVFLMTLSMFTVIPFSAAHAEDRGVMINGTFYETGSTYTHNIYLETTHLINSADLEVTYPGDLLSVTNATMPNFPEGTAMANTDEAGFIYFAASTLDAVDFSEKKVLATVEFLVTGETGSASFTATMNELISDGEVMLDLVTDAADEFELSEEPIVTEPEGVTVNGTFVPTGEEYTFNYYLQSDYLINAANFSVFYTDDLLDVSQQDLDDAANFVSTNLTPNLTSSLTLYNFTEIPGELVFAATANDDGTTTDAFVNGNLLVTVTFVVTGTEGSATISIDMQELAAEDEAGETIELTDEEYKDEYILSPEPIEVEKGVTVNGTFVPTGEEYTFTYYLQSDYLINAANFSVFYTDDLLDVSQDDLDDATNGVSTNITPNLTSSLTMYNFTEIPGELVFAATANDDGTTTDAFVNGNLLVTVTFVVTGTEGSATISIDMQELAAEDEAGETIELTDEEYKDEYILSPEPIEVEKGVTVNGTFVPTGETYNYTAYMQADYPVTSATFKVNYTNDKLEVSAESMADAANKTYANITPNLDGFFTSYNFTAFADKLAITGTPTTSTTDAFLNGNVLVTVSFVVTGTEGEATISITMDELLTEDEDGFPVVIEDGNYIISNDPITGPVLDVNDGKLKVGKNEEFEYVIYFENDDPVLSMAVDIIFDPAKVELVRDASTFPLLSNPMFNQNPTSAGDGKVKIAFNFMNLAGVDFSEIGAILANIRFKAIDTGVTEITHTFNEIMVLVDGADVELDPNDATVVDEELICLNHTLSEWVVTKDPECEVAGEKTRECSRCEYVEVEEIPALEHNYTWEVTTAGTCTVPGEETGTCTECGDVTTREGELDPDNHVNVETVIDPAATCTDAGLKQEICSDCDEVISSTPVNPLGHNYDNWEETTPGTCTDKAIETGTCTRCGDTTTREGELDPDNHDYDNWEETTPGTCTDKAIETGTCTRCGDTTTREGELDPDNHDYQWEVTTPGTCTDKAEETGTCTRCNDVITREGALDPNNHSGETAWRVVTEATPTTEGLEEEYYTCCGETTGETRAIPRTALYGDINLDGKVTMQDILLGQKAIAYMVELNEQQFINGDVNGDGKVTMIDLLLIQKYIAYMIDKFPVEE